MRTLRFKLAPNVQDLLAEFARSHVKHSLKDYRSAWACWCSRHQELLDTEVERLRELGYTGDAMDKMYKAGRYYFSHKRASPSPRPRARTRSYVTVTKDTLTRMDQHILAVRSQKDFRPAASFERFASENNLSTEEEALLAKGVSLEKVRAKLKHTYKNRCFLIRRREASGTTSSAT